jgi:glycosyltransferase involved in cell wall biosynthesis
VYRPLPVEEIRTVQKRLGLPESYFLFVGTFEPRKNLPGLLDAYHLLRESLPDAPPLVLVGTRGWLYESIFARVAELGLETHVCWLENLSAIDLPAVYNGATALITPSFYEGFGLPALEAMACGVPTIVSNRGSLPEVVGDTGLLIDPDRPDDLADAMRRILIDSDLRQRSSEAGRTRAASFTWRHTAEIALSVYRRVLSC